MFPVCGLDWNCLEPLFYTNSKSFSHVTEWPQIIRSLNLTLDGVRMLSISSCPAGFWWASWWTLAAAPCEEVATTACASSSRRASARHPPASRAAWSSDTSWRLCRPWWRARGWRAGWWRWARPGLSFWGRYRTPTRALFLITSMETICVW